MYNRSATPLARVQVEQNSSGGAWVWLRDEVLEVEEDGQVFWETFGEVSALVVPAPTVDEIEADFEGWYETVEEMSMSDDEKIEKLRAQVLFTALMTDTEV